jgi:hypothetical protein
MFFGMALPPLVIRSDAGKIPRRCAMRKPFAGVAGPLSRTALVFVEQALAQVHYGRGPESDEDCRLAPA